MYKSKLVFQDAEKARDAICVDTQKEIKKMYEDWSKEMGEKAKYYHTKTTASSYWQEQQALELQRQLKEQANEISKQIDKKAKESMYTVSESVVGCNAEYLKALGFTDKHVGMAFTSVPTQVVNNIITGNIYDTRWSLSGAIWSDNQKTQRDIYAIVAKGRAQNASAYDIAKMLEKYVNPDRAKQWNLKAPDGVYIYKRSVDYNAQRLVRTLTQHAYQQSIIQIAKDNPFIGKIIWRANGSRVCGICADRDGQDYSWSSLPMDHPNGMCVMEPVVDINKSIDQLADWINADDGTYPNIDNFASKFGYVPGASKNTAEQDKWLKAAGYSNGQMPKSFTEFAHNLSLDQQTELLKAAGGSWSDPHPYQIMEKYYYNNIAKPAGKVSVKTEVGLNTFKKSNAKTFNYWYSKLSDEEKAIAKKLKEESGLSWQKWYEKNIYTGKAKIVEKEATQSAAKTTKLNRNAWMDRFKNQTETKMLSTEASQLAKMTVDELNGVKEYTSSSYEKMNGYLRLRAKGMSHNEAMKKSGISEYQYEQMQNAINGMKKATLPQDSTLRRGTDIGDLAGFLPGDFRENKKMLENKSAEELNKMFKDKPGTYSGFTSTSSDYNKGFSGPVEIIFHAPKDTKATSIMSISEYGPSEGETLLAPGTHVVVKNIEKSDGHFGSKIRIWMEIVN